MPSRKCGSKFTCCTAVGPCWASAENLMKLKDCLSVHLLRSSLCSGQMFLNHMALPPHIHGTYATANGHSYFWESIFFLGVDAVQLLLRSRGGVGGIFLHQIMKDLRLRRLFFLGCTNYSFLFHKQRLAKDRYWADRPMILELTTSRATCAAMFEMKKHIEWIQWIRPNWCKHLTSLLSADHWKQLAQCLVQIWWLRRTSLGLLKWLTLQQNLVKP